MGDGGGAAVSLVDEDHHEAVAVGHLIPLGGVEEDAVGLGIAGVSHHDGGLLAGGAVGDVDQILTGIVHAVAVVVGEGEHANLDGALGGLGVSLAPQLHGDVLALEVLAVEGGDGLAGSGLLLGGDPGGGVVHAQGQGVGVSEGVLIAGVDGQERVNVGGRGLALRDLDLGDAVLGVGVQSQDLGVGLLGLEGVGVDALIEHAVHGLGDHVAGGLPIVDVAAVSVVDEPGGNGDLGLGDHLHAHLLEGALEVGDVGVAAGLDAVVLSLADLGQLVGGDTLAVHIDLADDKDGILGGPQLHGSAALAVSGQIELTEGGEDAHAVGVAAASQEADGGGDVVGLFLSGAPAVGTGLQNEQAFALLVGQRDPAVLGQEFQSVHAVRHGHHGEVGADGGLFGDVDLDGAALGHVLGEPAGQRQLGSLGPVDLQLGDGVQILHGLLNDHGVVLRKGGSAVVADTVFIHAELGDEVPGHGDLGGVAVVLTQVGLAPDDHGDLLLVVPGVEPGTGAAFDLGIGVVGSSLRNLQAVGFSQIAEPALHLIGGPQILHQEGQVALTVDQHGGNGLALAGDRVAAEGSGAHGGEEFGVGQNESLDLTGTQGVAGAIDAGPVDLAAQDLILLQKVAHGAVGHVGVLPGQSHAAAIGLAEDDDDHALVIGYTPPLGGVETDGDALGVAGELEDDGSLLPGAVGDIHQILAGIQHAVTVVVGEGHDAGFHDALADLALLAGQDVIGVVHGAVVGSDGSVILHLLAVAQIGAGLGGLLGLDTDGGVILTLADVVAVSEGDVIAAVAVQELGQVLGVNVLTGHLDLRDAVLLVGTVVGVLSLEGVGILGLPEHAVLGGFHTVVGGLPIGHAVGIRLTHEPGGNGDFAAGDGLGGVAVLAQDLLELVQIGDAGVIAAGVGAVIDLGADFGQILGTGAHGVDIGLAADQDGTLHGPGLQSGGTLFIADQIEGTVVGEQRHAGIVLAGVDEGHGVGHIGQLGV